MTLERTSPSAFMRQLRPENYSDTAERASYVLDAPVFEYHLESLTARNQTHDFEIFCRKLCEKVICPNLRPQTGPDGGGDSKTDTETFPVADEIAMLTFVGEPKAGAERWAFAFSAKKDWRRKVRDDVAGIAGTNRGYARIICVTSQSAKAKTRAALEDELTAKFGIPVTIHDRSWIVQQIIDNERRELAYHYLHVGQEVMVARRLGPSDYSRIGQLEAIEKSLADPDSFTGMRLQQVTEALLAAKLSRSLECPRPETDGRFQRATRLADEHGTFRQKLETRYEALWTAVWWFDDIDLINAEYDRFESMAIGSDHAINLEFISNLLQILFNAVIHGHYEKAKCDLEARAGRLYAKLDAVAAENEWPNNALRARTLRLLGRLNVAMLEKDAAAISAAWPEFSGILTDARNLGEYDASQLLKLIDAVGGVAGNDPAYNALVEDVASFVSERTGEAEGALVLLKRAQQLDLDDHFDMIRLLGRAARQLTKKEYADQLMEALHLLSVAYRSAGLLWAARASCIFVAMTIAIQGEEDSELNVTIVPAFTTFVWICLELRHFPDVLEGVQFLNGCLRGLPLDDESRKQLQSRLTDFDLALGSQFLNFNLDELNAVAGLPDVLEALSLFTARTSLLYVLGYKDLLREDGSLPTRESDEAVSEMLNLLASQPVSDDMRGPLITNLDGPQRLQSTVMGMQVAIGFEGTITSSLVAQALLASIEACFATAFELEVHPHTERFEITLIEVDDAKESNFEINTAGTELTILWPRGVSPASFNTATETTRFLMQVAIMVMVSCCAVKRSLTDMMDQLSGNEAVLDRITMITVTPTSYNRLFSKSLARIDDRAKYIRASYPPRDERPKIERKALEHADEPTDAAGEARELTEKSWKGTSHRDVEVRSVIDYHLWNNAGWKGALYMAPSAGPPCIAFLFTNGEVARGIFGRWRERFGKVDSNEEIYLSVVRDVSEEHPAHYTLLISSRPERRSLKPAGTMFMSRFHRMEPASDENIVRFLTAYHQAGAYVLMPAVLNAGEPTPLFNLAIMKKELAVKSAKFLGPLDVEQCAVGPSVEALYEKQRQEPA